MQGPNMVENFANLINPGISPTAGSGGAKGVGAGSTSGAAGAGGASFKDVLMNSLNEVNNMTQDANTKLDNYVTGKTDNLGEVISASQKANLAFSLLVQIRNQLQTAYDQVQNLQI